MPLINIYLQSGRTQAQLQAIGDTIHQALMETWEIPEKDRFQIYHEKLPEHFCMDREMWDVKRSDDLLVLHITTSPRSKQMKLNFYKRLAELLQQNIKRRLVCQYSYK